MSDYILADRVTLSPLYSAASSLGDDYPQDSTPSSSSPTYYSPYPGKPIGHVANLAIVSN